MNEVVSLLPGWGWGGEVAGALSACVVVLEGSPVLFLSVGTLLLPHASCQSVLGTESRTPGLVPCGRLGGWEPLPEF